MTNLGQLIAAVSGGALWAIGAMQTFRQWDCHRKAERAERVKLATQAILNGVQCKARERPGHPNGAEAAGTSDTVRARAHLSLITPRVARPQSPQRRSATNGPTPPLRTQSRAGRVSGR